MFSAAAERAAMPAGSRHGHGQSGGGIKETRSKRPGRRRAVSIVQGRLVAPDQNAIVYRKTVESANFSKVRNVAIRSCDSILASSGWWKTSVHHD
jgi:hypothetical protein